jgi:hypothetical protein
MNTKYYLPLLLYGAIVLNAGVADTPKPAVTVAVYNFTGEADAASYLNKVTTLVAADLTTEPNLALLERAELGKALSEQAFDTSGMVSSDAAAKIGRITGAKVLVSGQVIKISDNHLVLVADIIGTETGRLFADKVEGAPSNVMNLTFELSRKIARTINDQTNHLLGAAHESKEERMDRIIKGISGTNRPSVSVKIQWREWGQLERHDSTAVNSEFGTILLKSGFTVVDDKSSRKPDFEITGYERNSEGARQGDLFSVTDELDLKVQERRTGNILAIEHCLTSGTGGGNDTATAAAQANGVDTLAERILPLLAK